MEELRNALNELYDRFGYNEVTVALSQILDEYIAQKQAEKIANTPERCFIYNDDVNGLSVPRALDKKWYIDMAYKRLMDFLGG